MLSIRHGKTDKIITHRESYAEFGFSTGAPNVEGFKRTSAWAVIDVGKGGDRSVENRFPPFDFGGGGVGARSCTERPDCADVALPGRR